MADSKISALTSASALAGTEQFAIADGTATSKAATSAQIRTYAGLYGSDFSPASYQWIKLAGGDKNLTNTASLQALFSGVAGATNGAVTVGTGTFFFECMFYITTMSATSGNAQFDLVGTGLGTATLADIYYSIVGLDNSNPLNAATPSGGMNITSASPASMVTAGTGTGLYAHIRGTFGVSSGGTVVPSIKLVTANAAVLKTGAYFKLWQAASGTTYVSGSWS